jgi:hypothetical protein
MFLQFQKAWKLIGLSRRNERPAVLLALLLLVPAVRSSAHAWSPSNDNDRLTELHYKLGKAYNDLPTSDLDQATKSCNAALKLNPTHPKTNELLSTIELEQSRREPKRNKRKELLDSAISHARAAIEHCPDDDARTKISAQIALSSACVERANYYKNDREKDLREAASAATIAIELQQRASMKDYPYLAQGNAFEDIAWLCRSFEKEVADSEVKSLCRKVNEEISIVTKQPRLSTDTDKFDSSSKTCFYYYLSAIDAFWQYAAESQEDKSAQAIAYASIGRCLKRMAIESWLYPGFDGNSDRANLLRMSREFLVKASENDANRVVVLQLLGASYCIGDSNSVDWIKADGYLRKAKDAAIKQNLDSRAIYAADWMQFPLNVPLKDEIYWKQFEQKNYEVVAKEFGRLFPDAGKISQNEQLLLKETLLRMLEISALKLSRSPGEIRDIEKSIAVNKAIMAYNPKKPESSLEILNLQLPKNRADALPCDFELLCQRAEWTRKTDPASAIEDAERAAAIAIWPDQEVRALEIQISVCVDQKNSNKALDKAREAKKLSCPRCADFGKYFVLSCKLDFENDPQNISKLVNLIEARQKNYDLQIEENKRAKGVQDLTTTINNAVALSNILIASTPAPKNEQVQQALATWNKIKGSLSGIPPDTTKSLTDSLEKLKAKAEPSKTSQ